MRVDWTGAARAEDPHLQSTAASGPSSSPAWRATLLRHKQSSTPRAIWQILNTGVPYVGLWYLMHLLSEVSIWYALPVAVLAGALLVRVFIIFHDCGHGSFLRARWANDLVGFISGLLTFTPYFHWRWQHAIHHGTAGQLETRGTGDIWTLTVQEYLDASPTRRLAYRIARNPFVLFGIAPLLVFVFQQRIPSRKASARERRSVWWMNLAIAALVLLMSKVFGLSTYLLLQGVAWAVAGAGGIWLFYIQHQFEDTYWERKEDWNYVTAALKGSSFYKLPKVLQWLSGNIGFHHIHHLDPGVPNYNLQRCHEAHPFFQQVTPVTLMSSLRALTLHLWDENAGKLVGFSRLRRATESAPSARRRTRHS